MYVIFITCEDLITAISYTILSDNRSAAEVGASRAWHQTRHTHLIPNPEHSAMVFTYNLAGDRLKLVTSSCDTCGLWKHVEI